MYQKMAICSFCILSWLSSASLALADRIHVDHESTNNGPGTSSDWSDAWDNLDDALANAASGDEIWVADGTYYPSAQTDPYDSRSATFSMLPGVKIFGGFQGISRSGGGETALNQRNPDLYETILSGDIGIANDPSDNAYHVVTADNVDDLSSRLNGFTIRNAHWHRRCH